MKHTANKFHDFRYILTNVLSLFTIALFMNCTSHCTIHYFTKPNIVAFFKICGLRSTTFMLEQIKLMFHEQKKKKQFLIVCASHWTEEQLKFFFHLLWIFWSPLLLTCLWWWWKIIDRTSLVWHQYKLLIYPLNSLTQLKEANFSQ